MSLQEEKRYLKKEKIRVPNDAWKSSLTTWRLNLPAAIVNALMHVVLWLTAIKLNPS